MYFYIHKILLGNSLVVQEPALSLSRAQVQSLLRELRSYKQSSVAKYLIYLCMCIYIYIFFFFEGGFPCGSASKESVCNEGDLGSIPGLGRSPGEGKGCLLWYAGLEKELHGLHSPWGGKESDTTEQLSLSFIFMYLKIYHLKK